MKQLIELSTDRDFEEFAEVLEKVRDSHAVGNLKQVVVNGEECNYTDLQRVVAETKVMFQINGDFCYVTLSTASRNDVQQIRNFWNTVLQRGTQRFKKGEVNDYLLTIDICRNELNDRTSYLVSCVQPVFVTSESERDLMLVFPLENVYFTKAEVDIYDLEYEMSTMDDSNINYGEYDDEEESEEEYNENDDFLATDQFTEV